MQRSQIFMQMDNSQHFTANKETTHKKCTNRFHKFPSFSTNIHLQLQNWKYFAVEQAFWQYIIVWQGGSWSWRTAKESLTLARSPNIFSAIHSVVPQNSLTCDFLSAKRFKMRKQNLKVDHQNSVINFDLWSIRNKRWMRERGRERAKTCRLLTRYP